LGYLTTTKERRENLSDLGIDGSWTLFLDRDGVINRQIKGDYVREWAQFEFLPDVPEALRRLSVVFGRIIVVTNQRGVARNLIGPADLTQIHENMIKRVSEAGGRINGVYVCPHDFCAHCKCRKPEIGLALSAKSDFPDIDFFRSIMVGDDSSDIVFAKNLNMKSVLVGDNINAQSNGVIPDFIIRDLFDFAVSLHLI
jgi:D-glycero-D-manno-heptose 1,7-bisphosphate phosphatase